jgi:putative acetyltransferase
VTAGHRGISSRESVTCRTTIVTPLIRPETAEDDAAIREIHRQAFGRDDEALLVDALREQGYARLSLVAVEGARPVGHILFSDLPIVTDDRIVPALALAPLAVIPSQQGRGIGSSLVWRGLEACAEAAHAIVIVLGHPWFYPRFGFSTALARSLRSPFPRDAFMAVELVPGALTEVVGEVRYPPPFGIAPDS